jgi:hypothetical protein
MKTKNCFSPRGFFHVELIRDGKVIHKETAPNGVTNIGKDTILDSFFRNQAPPTTWYIGFIDQSGYTAVADADTMSSHAGWTEFTTYSEGVRQTWVTVAAASQSISNTTLATFNITGSGTLKGVFVADNSTKAGSTGTLWATALFAGDIPVSNTDIIKITYTVNAT